MAALLGGAMVWLAIGGSLETYAGPSQVKLNGDTYRLNAVVSPGAPKDAGDEALTADGTRFTVQDQEDPTKTVDVVYKGVVPDTFKDGREIVVTGKMEGGIFVAKRDTLLTKCPSKFDSKKSPEHEVT